MVVTMPMQCGLGTDIKMVQLFFNFSIRHSLLLAILNSRSFKFLPAFRRTSAHIHAYLLATDYGHPMKA